MSRLNRIIAACFAVLVVAVLVLLARVAALSDRPEVETVRGTVGNVSSDAIVIETDDGRTVTGPMVNEDGGTIRPGDRVVARVIDDPNVVMVVEYRRGDT